MPKTAKKTVVKKAAKKKSASAMKAAAKPSARKPAAVRDRATTATPARVMTRRAGGKTEVIAVVSSVTSEEIALKAYYLAERRRHLGLPGDPEADWLQAERELRG